jgi:ribosomal protein S18 acetylase RimI-like enzyme
MPPAIVDLREDHLPALRTFLDALPDGDVTFIKEDVRNPDTAASWARPGARGRWWVATEDDGAVLGLVSISPLLGWSAHVGDLRLVVDPERRGRGVGASLARHALRQALEAGLQKVVVEVVAEQEGAIRMFTDLGFRGEALLTDHIRDRAGELQDLLVLAHAAGEEWSTISTLGVEEDVA